MVITGVREGGVAGAKYLTALEEMGFCHDPATVALPIAFKRRSSKDPPGGATG